jgi:uncharacterized damage-inducible protein DinB
MKNGMAIAVFLLLSLLSQPARSADNPSSLTGVRADIVAQINMAEDHIVQLANAVPADKYGWRPGEGVRSVGEVYLHIVQGNYHFPEYAGFKSPESLPRNLEKMTTDKAKIVQLLKDSFENLKQAVAKTPDSDLDRKIKVFGMDMTVRGLFMTAASHMHEHLGQSIAYARTIGVVPPWSAKENAPQTQSQTSSY